MRISSIFSSYFPKSWNFAEHSVVVHRAKQEVTPHQERQLNNATREQELKTTTRNRSVLLLISSCTLEVKILTCYDSAMPERMHAEKNGWLSRTASAEPRRESASQPSFCSLIERSKQAPASLLDQRVPSRLVN